MSPFCVTQSSLFAGLGLFLLKTHAEKKSQENRRYRQEDFRKEQYKNYQYKKAVMF